MYRKLSHFVCATLFLGLTGSHVTQAEVWEGIIATSADAVEDQISSMYSGSSDLELPWDGGPQVIGLRFLGVAVPKGASIDAAYIEFTVDEQNPDLPVNLVIDAEANPTPASFGSQGGDVNNRTRTIAKTYWHPEHFPTVGGKHQTADSSLVIEEVVNLPGWSSNGNIVLIIMDDPDNASG